MLKSRITRIIAGIIACIMVFICVAQCVGLYLKTEDFYNSRNHLPRTDVIEKASKLSEKLFLAGYMYLNNLDSKGDFNGSKYAEAQTISTLQKLGIMDKNKKLDFGNTDNLEYRMTINGQEISNTDKSHNELSGYYANQFDHSSFHSNFFGVSNDFNWFTTNYGMTYYYINGRGYAIFDFDTRKCDSYVDELGARIYYKLDGTTPIPFDYVNFSEEELAGIYGEEETEVIYDDIDQQNPNESNMESIVSPVYDENKFKKIQEDESGITITIAPTTEVIAEIEKWYNEQKEIDAYIMENLVNLIPFIAVAVIMVIFILIAGGYSKNEKKFVLTAVDRIYAEFPVIIGILTVFGAAALGAMIKDVNSDIIKTETFCICYGIGGAVLFGIALFMLNTIVIRLKCHSLFKTTLLYRILMPVGRFIKKGINKLIENKVTRDMVRNDVFTKNFLFRTALFLIIGIVVGLLCCVIESAPLLIICEAIVLASYVYTSLTDFKALERLSQHITAIKFGDYSPRMESTDSPIITHTKKLNEISAGVQETVENQVKSERMKIELVTNVSHDLKTPLTSIISYIDLLSSEELSPVARDYVTVIENKSQRLKSMVADLFDLAKATSRTDVQTEEIDAVVLTNQVIGDLEDKIEASGRNFVADIQADSAPVNAEGRKMYRVFQNVIDNALKYSMEGTRVFLSLKNENGNCIITVKNTASYEMTFSPDEITERFTRGDESRTTEGNGLGLSIAKTFTEACGGKFTVVIDGDVFKAVIELPLIEK